MSAPRTTTDVVGAFCAVACVLMAAVGAGLALAGLDATHHGGGDLARVLLLVGLALLSAGTGGGVLVAGGRR